jgi:hypothetical protein
MFHTRSATAVMTSSKPNSQRRASRGHRLGPDGAPGASVALADRVAFPEPNPCWDVESLAAGRATGVAAAEGLSVAVAG